MIITKKISILALAGFSLTIFGGILCFCWDSILNYVIKKESRLTPTSKLFELWKDLPIDIDLGIYFFNWTNPEEVLDDGFKPKFVEVGPYTFKEQFGKVNVTWNNNGTITYRIRRFWHFDPENSVGSLDDNITTLNPVPLSAAYVTRYNLYFFQMAISSTIRISRQNIWITKTVGEFMFAGYPDPLMTLANSLPFLAKSGLTGNKFSWFYNRNGSSEHEGIYNMETGEYDVSKTGIMREWNYKNTTDFYRAECGMINGSDGIFFHAGQRRDESIEIFSADFCKSIKLSYLEDTEVDGIHGYTYAGTEMLMDNGELDPNNWCNCNGECLPRGTMNLSACHYGAPAFASYPHFLYADPYYLQQIEGLQPDEVKHRTYSTLEPKTGFPLEAVARMQMNLLLQPYENIALYNNVPRIVFPMLWLQKSARLPPEYITYFKFLLAIPEKGMYFSMGLVLLGIIMVTIAFVTSCNRNSRRNNMQGQKSYAVQQSMKGGNNKGALEEHILLEKGEQVNEKHAF